MKYSQAIEQACAVLALLALEGDDTALTNDDLNERIGASPTYLRKITRKLVVHGLVTSTHGAGGGYVLARPLEEITLFDVIEALYGSQRIFKSSGLIEKVFSDRKQQVELGLTILEDAFAEAQGKLNAELQKTRLSDIAERVKQSND